MRDFGGPGKRKISVEEGEKRIRKRGKGPPVDDDENNVLRVRPMEALYLKHGSGRAESRALHKKASKTSVDSGKKSSTKNQRTRKLKTKLQCTGSNSPKSPVKKKKCSRGEKRKVLVVSSSEEDSEDEDGACVKDSTASAFAGVGGQSVQQTKSRIGSSMQSPRLIQHRERQHARNPSTMRSLQNTLNNMSCTNPKGELNDSMNALRHEDVATGVAEELPQLNAEAVNAGVELTLRPQILEPTSDVVTLKEKYALEDVGELLMVEATEDVGEPPMVQSGVPIRGSKNVIANHPKRTPEDVRKELESMLEQLPPSEQAIFLERKSKICGF